MYNRYIPSPDGTFRREIVPDFPTSPPPEPITVQYESVSEKPQISKGNESSAEDGINKRSHESKQPDSHVNEALSSKTAGLRRFLPPSVDTGDLLVLLILLLLLVDGDEDDYLSVILTIAAFILL